VTDGLPAPPQYFPLNVKMNKEGYEDIKSVIESGSRPLSPEDFEIAANETGAIVLDVRHQTDFAKGHIPQSIFIGIDGSFAPWVGTIIGNVKQPILLIIPKGREGETLTRLARVGFDNTLGYLKGGLSAWKRKGKTIDKVKGIDVKTFKTIAEKRSLNIFDVRKNLEYNSEHLENANSTPLDFLNNHMSDFPLKGDFYIHCAGGYRSIIAASILKSRGIHNLINVDGGFAAIKKEGFV
ncbi:MAG: rhodanese-like domain-containing protein, partial [Flavobacteriales bacterium]